MTPKIVALVPAHNEGKDIANTIQSLKAQSMPPSEIVVMCDNCTDNTAEIAASFDGVRVMHSVKNTGRKAGAMNQALATILPSLEDEDLVLCMDADTVLHPDLIRNATSHFALIPQLGAVSSNHLVHDHSNLMELLQAMEYERDRRFIGRKGGKHGCMTGMAALYLVKALRQVEAVHGTVYDPSNWTEDWKLTIALKKLDWQMRRPQDCLASTVPVSTVKGLFTQRVRWARGYIQTLCQFGFDKYTALSWIKQAGLLWSVLTRLLVVLVIIMNYDHPLSWWMIPIYLILTADSVNTVRKAGRKAVVVAILSPIEMVYNWIILAAIITGYFKHFSGFGAQDTWARVRR